MEGHIFAPHRNKKYPFLCQMDPFLKLFPYVYLCCRCRIMHTQDTGYLYVLALSMIYSRTFPLCGTCVIRPSARSWAGTSAVAPQECHFKLALFLRVFARSHFSWNVRKKILNWFYSFKRYHCSLGCWIWPDDHRHLTVVYVSASPLLPSNRKSPVLHTVSYPCSFLDKCQKKNLLPYFVQLFTVPAEDQEFLHESVKYMATALEVLSPLVVGSQAWLWHAFIVLRSAAPCGF